MREVGNDRCRSEIEVSVDKLSNSKILKVISVLKK